MKIASILDYLKADSELTTMINHKQTHPKITAYTAHDKNAYPFIVVKLEPFITDTLIGQYRCEIRVVTDDVLMIEPITEKVINRLHLLNRPSVKQGDNLILTSTQSGGTLVVDEEKGIYEQLIIFNLKFKRRKR